MLFNYVYKNGKNYFWVDVYPIKISMCIIEKNPSNHKSFKNRLECMQRERDFTTFLQIQNSQGRGESFTMFTFDLIMEE